MKLYQAWRRRKKSVIPFTLSKLKMMKLNSWEFRGLLPMNLLKVLKILLEVLWVKGVRCTNLQFYDIILWLRTVHCLLIDSIFLYDYYYYYYYFYFYSCAGLRCRVQTNWIFGVSHSHYYLYSRLCCDFTGHCRSGLEIFYSQVSSNMVKC